MKKSEAKGERSIHSEKRVDQVIGGGLEYIGVYDPPPRSGASLDSASSHMGGAPIHLHPCPFFLCHFCKRALNFRKMTKLYKTKGRQDPILLLAFPAIVFSPSPLLLSPPAPSQMISFCQRLRIHTHAHTHIHIHTHVLTRTHTQTRVRTHAHTNTHTKEVHMRRKLDA